MALSESGLTAGAAALRLSYSLPLYDKTPYCTLVLLELTGPTNFSMVTLNRFIISLVYTSMYAMVSLWLCNKPEFTLPGMFSLQNNLPFSCTHL